MKKNYPFSQIQSLLSSIQKILILIPKGPTFDQVAAALAFFLALGKAGKKAVIACPDKMIVSFSHLVGLDQVKNAVSGNELVVTLDIPVENIEKVFTTNEESGRLQIIIRAKPGEEPVSQENLSFSSQAGAMDLVITVGAHKPEGLGNLYQEKKELFEKAAILNLDNQPQNTNFGKINVVDAQASCLSEMVAILINELKLPIDADIAGNLLLGLRRGTDNFQRKEVSAATFEAAALAARFREQTPSEEVPGVGVGEAPPDLSSPPPDWLEPKIYKGSTLP